jgi:hypothetical protein
MPEGRSHFGGPRPERDMRKMGEELTSWTLKHSATHRYSATPIHSTA